MLYPRAEHEALAQIVDLEAQVREVEDRLQLLGEALRERDAAAVELQSEQLHAALARAVQSVMHAARHGGVPDPMRLRLARAGAQVARQREVLARATAALDRAIDLLLPGNATAHKVYNAAGQSEPLLRGGSISA